MTFRRFLIAFCLLLSLFLVSALYLLEIDITGQRNKLLLWDLSEKESLRVGDIILRSAYGKESRIIEMVSGGEYSHIAVITAIEPEILVTHATTNENDDFLNQVQVTAITEFLSPTVTKRYLVARPNFLNTTEKRLFSEQVYAQNGEAYLLKSRDLENLYCTTLLEKPLSILRPELQLQWQQVNVPGMNGEYLFPDAFLAIPGLDILLKDDQWVLPRPDFNEVKNI